MKKLEQSFILLSIWFLRLLANFKKSIIALSKIQRCSNNCQKRISKSASPEKKIIIYRLMKTKRSNSSCSTEKIYLFSLFVQEKNRADMENHSVSTIFLTTYHYSKYFLFSEKKRLLDLNELLFSLSVKNLGYKTFFSL